MRFELKSFWKLLPAEWLLQGEPYIQYRVHIDLFNRAANDNEINLIEKSISNHKSIKRLFDNQNQDGYWGASKDIFTWWPPKDTTFWILGVLAEFGLKKHIRKIAGACEYVFSTQLPNGGFGWAPPPTAGDCFTGILTESLAKIGYVSDPRLQKACNWLIARQRLDGGFWCKNTGLPGKPRQHEPSCAFATLCVLGALSLFPELKNTEITDSCVEFLFQCWENRGKIKYAGHDSQVGQGWDKLKYPFTDYRILKYLDILTRFDYACRDRRMKEIIELLIAKHDKDGRFYAESIHKCWSDYDFGQKKSPSRWITLLVYRIAKRVMDEERRE